MHQEKRDEARAHETEERKDKTDLIHGETQKGSCK